MNDESEIKRIHEVSAITESDRRAFYDWVQVPDHKGTLMMPPDAMRYAIIPERVLELAHSPSAVSLLAGDQSPSYLNVVSFETRNEPITNEASYRAYFKQEGALIPRPADVDEFHVQEIDLVDKGLLSLHDYIFQSINLRIKNVGTDKALHVDIFTARTGQGIAQSWYLNRIREVAQAMGMRYIIGANNPENIDFFIHKLKRNTLEDIKEEYKDMFDPGDVILGPEYFTIDFLHEEDREIFLSK